MEDDLNFKLKATLASTELGTAQPQLVSLFFLHISHIVGGEIIAGLYDIN